MFDRIFGLIYDAVEKRKRLILSAVLLVSLLSLAGLFRIKFDSNILLMLPKHDVISKIISFMQNSDLSGRVILSLNLTSDEKGINELHHAVDAVASSLDPELFPEVTTGMSQEALSKDMDLLMENVSAILTEKELAAIDSRLNRDGVSKIIENSYRQLLKPGGIFLNTMIRSDPLSLKLLILERLRALSSSVGYEVEMKDGHFVSRDGRHAMIIVRTTVPVADVLGAKRLFSSMDRTLDQLPEGISADIICGHAHTLSNEEIIRRDVRLTLGIASIAFLIFFVVVIGDVSALLIYLIPVLSVILSINLTYWILGSLSYSVIGIGVVVAGISVDYGIHVFIAAKQGRDATSAVKVVAKPVTIGALTTAGIFLAFFFSGIEGYSQMAVFTMLSILLSLFYAVLVMPHFISGRRNRTGLQNHLAEMVNKFRCSNLLTVLLWAVVTIILAYFSLHIGFDSDISAVDGTDKEIIRREEQFNRVWGQKKLGILVAEAPGYEEALELNEKIYPEAAEAVGEKNFSSIAGLWPSEKTRKENYKRWLRFWSGEREQKLRKLLVEEGRPFGFSDHAFDPFFDHLYSAEGAGQGTFSNGMVLGLGERFIRSNGRGYQVLSFFPDSRESVDALAPVSRTRPGTYLVSASLLSEVISEVLSEDMKLMTLAAAVFIVVLTMLLLKSIREAAVALVPVATGLIWSLGLMSFLGISLNVANLVAAMLVMGLCDDFGILMLYKTRADMETGTLLAVTLSAVSTLLGAGLLLLAKHPALFSFGITLFIGVSAGYLSSVLVVPKLYELLVPGAKEVRIT